LCFVRVLVKRKRNTTVFFVFLCWKQIKKNKCFNHNPLWVFHLFLFCTCVSIRKWNSGHYFCFSFLKMEQEKAMINIYVVLVCFIIFVFSKRKMNIVICFFFFHSGKFGKKNKCCNSHFPLFSFCHLVS
jgi:hypothetical protein